MIQKPIYMDNNATTRVDKRVVAVMMPYFVESYGNAGSRHHRFGRAAHTAVEAARGQVAELINADDRSIFFTSGATESDNMAVKGTARLLRDQGDHIITAVTEHKAVLGPCKRLEREGFRVTFLQVDRFGCVDVEQIAGAMAPGTILVSIMAANNETGTVQPVREIGSLCRERGVRFHCDATQAIGKIPIDVEDQAIDLLSLSGHKLYGPKGIGALFVRRAQGQVPLEPLFEGGDQEEGLRSGTLPVSSVVGLGKACELSGQEMAAEGARLARLRDRLQDGIIARVSGVHVNGHPQKRLPGTVNLSFDGIEAESLIFAMEDVAVSPGSACTSASSAPSYVLKALGLSDSRARASVRFSLGRYNTEEEVDWVVTEVAQAIRQLRDRRRQWGLHESVPSFSRSGVAV